MLRKAEQIGNFTRTEEPQMIRLDGRLEIMSVHLPRLQHIQTPWTQMVGWSKTKHSQTVKFIHSYIYQSY